MGRTHIITYTKGEPRGRPQNPFMCRKTILEMVKVLSISDLDKYPFLHLVINYSCSVNILHQRMIFQFFVNNLLSEEDSQALHMKTDTVVTHVHNFIEIPFKICCKNWNKTLELILPFISWNFYTKRNKNCNTKVNLQQNTVCLEQQILHKPRKCYISAACDLGDI